MKELIYFIIYAYFDVSFYRTHTNDRLRQNYKGEEIPTDSVQRNSGNHSIAEQFPSLGNWVARMSKKQSSMSKSKLHVVENVPLVPTENITRVRAMLLIEFLDFLSLQNIYIYILNDFYNTS